MWSHDEIEALYASGCEVVVSVIEQWPQPVVLLTARISERAQRRKQDSHHSHKPAASDGLAKKPRSQRQARGKRAGAQRGQRGVTRLLSDCPDQISKHAPAPCHPGQASLQTIRAEHAERRQVIELPPRKCQLSEPHAERKTCAQCQTVKQGQFPEAVSQPIP